MAHTQELLIDHMSSDVVNVVRLFVFMLSKELFLSVIVEGVFIVFTAKIFKQ